MTRYKEWTRVSGGGQEQGESWTAGGKAGRERGLRRVEVTTRTGLRPCGGAGWERHAPLRLPQTSALCSRDALRAGADREVSRGAPIFTAVQRVSFAFGGVRRQLCRAGRGRAGVRGEGPPRNLVPPGGGLCGAGDGCGSVLSRSYVG